MSLHRFNDAATARAVDRVAQELASPFAQVGPALEVFLPAVGDEAAVEHGLGCIPDGYLLLLTVGGTVQAARPDAWTETTAYLVADANNVRVRLMFVQCRKEIRNG